MRELKLEELSVKQKLGMVMTALAQGPDHQDTEFVLDMIKNHALGSVWVNPGPGAAKMIEMIRQTADYPILIMRDAESGVDPYIIGRHNALGCAGSEELAYTFGKLTAITAHSQGYNVVCNPVLDMVNGPGVCGSNVRSMGGDKYKVAKLAAAEARGMHDGGLLTVGKHYPGGNNPTGLDPHMAAVYSDQTKESLLDYNVYPYKELMKEDLLDGIMVQHKLFINIDTEYPSSLSKKVIDIIREQGFDGFLITDALCMMGVAAQFGMDAPRGLSIAAGNDLALPWVHDNRAAYESLCRSYEEGIITDERLDEAVRRVLEAQKKTLAVPKYTVITDEDMENFKRISKDAVYARTDEGVPPALSRDGKYFFMVMTDVETHISDEGKVTVDTFKGKWYNPQVIMERLEELFPNSQTRAISQFPSSLQVMRALEDSLGYDIVFITYQDAIAYTGREAFTPRITSLMEAMQTTKRISTVVHFGNPYLLEELPHIPRILIGCTSPNSILDTLEVLAGNYPAKGKLPYNVKLK